MFLRKSPEESDSINNGKEKNESIHKSSLNVLLQCIHVLNKLVTKSRENVESDNNKRGEKMAHNYGMSRDAFAR